MCALALTIIEEESDTVIGKDLRADRDLPEARPWQDDRDCQDQRQPERRGLRDGVAEGLGGALVVVHKQDNLAE